MEYSLDVSTIQRIQNLQEEMTLMKPKLETLQNLCLNRPLKSPSTSFWTLRRVSDLPPKMDEPKANLKEWRTLEEVEQMRIIREDFQRANELEMDWNDSLEVDGNPNTLYSKKG